MRVTDSIHTVIIGAGQAGLAAGYHLQKRGVPFVILESNDRVGDSWRKRWDSLRLFTPAKFDAIDGMRFPAPPNSFPTKNEMADYLESYARRFKLPVRTGVHVDALYRRGDKYVVSAGDTEIEADNVIVAMALYQKLVQPSFAGELDPAIVQFHSCDYRNPGQLRAGDVLLVGAGNSGAEIAMELSKSHRVFLAGRDVGHVPFRIESLAARLILLRLVLRVFFHRIATIRTPIGRRMIAKGFGHGLPWIRTKPIDLQSAGVQRVPRVAGVRAGKPVLEDGRVLDVANVIWCTGFHPAFSWIKLPVFGDHGLPIHERGVVTSEPGLYFAGMAFLYSASSTMIHGVSRDAAYIADAIAVRSRHRAAVPA